ncbi:YqzH family protein [Fredinandcohnia sp. 179-A 10B2 NHS]|uniref:YqzH family protein n=1 Tax=Fredinandcohnia sp. 179-A 10B2 NHS TaxID=3235176 RepID=UPI0039A3CD60
MDEKFIRKLIRNYFYQYHHDNDSVPLTEADYKELLVKIKELQQLDPETTLHDIINDLVYEYLTN